MRFVEAFAFWVAKICVLFLILFCTADPSWAQQAQKNAPATPPTASSSAPVAEPIVGHEDWTSITLEGSHFPTAVAVREGGISNLPQNSFIRELYDVEWRPNDHLDLYIIRPKNVAKPPVVLYLYGYPQDTERFKSNAWCTTVTAGGYAAVGFVSSLTGHRYHDRPTKEWFVSELQESLVTSTHDVQMILNYLAQRTDLDMQRVGMFGQGSGGTIAILASAADPRIKVLDVLRPWADWPEWLAKSKVVPEAERASYLQPEFLARVAPLDPVQWLPKVHAESIRIQDIRRDPENPEKAQVSLETAAPERAEIEQFGDGHAFYPASAGGEIFDWMKEQLQTNSKSLAASTPRVHYYPPAGSGPEPIPTPK